MIGSVFFGLAALIPGSIALLLVAATIAGVTVEDRRKTLTNRTIGGAALALTIATILFLLSALIASWI